MAKDKTGGLGAGDLFRKTETAHQAEQPPADNSDLDLGNIKATGIGLRAGELAALDSIAGRLGVARNALMRALIRWALIEYRAGRLDLAGNVEQPPPPKKRLRMP